MPAYLLGKSSYEIHQLYISRGLNHDMVVQTIHWQDLWTHLRRFQKSKYRICTMVKSCMGIILQGNWVAHEQWPNVDLLYLRQYPDATWDSQFKSFKAVVYTEENTRWLQAQVPNSYSSICQDWLKCYLAFPMLTAFWGTLQGALL
jgi:hypothetical protein